MDAGRGVAGRDRVERVLAFVDAVGQRRDRLAHLGFGKVVQAVERAEEDVGAVGAAEVLQAPGCDGGGGDLAEQVALGGDGVADVDLDHVDHGLVDAGG